VKTLFIDFISAKYISDLHHCLIKSYAFIRKLCASSLNELFLPLSSFFRGYEDIAMGTPLVSEVPMGDAEAGTSRKVAPITDFGKVSAKGLF
jgi:hypothetical protein